MFNSPDKSDPSASLRPNLPNSQNQTPAPKNKKLGKLNWQKNHSKKLPKNRTKIKKRHETTDQKNPNFANSQQNPSKNSSQNNGQIEQNINQKSNFPSFYKSEQTKEKNTQNLSKFQNNIQNVAQKLSFQIENIPKKINQNLANITQNQKNHNENYSQKSEANLQNSIDRTKNQFPNSPQKSLSNSLSDSFPNSPQNPLEDSQNYSQKTFQNTFQNTEVRKQETANPTSNSTSNFLFKSNNPSNSQFANSEFPNSEFSNSQIKQNKNSQFLTPKSNFQGNFQSSNSNSNFQSFSQMNTKHDNDLETYKVIHKTFKNKSTTISRQFAIRHTYRAGAIVWVKYRGENYYVVFRSLTRASRGIQLPGGRIERMENVADAVTREVYEEIGIQTRILCPLGFLFTENPSDNFSRIEIYYIVRPVFPIDVFRHWQHQDLDEKRQVVEKRQTLECWCVPCSREVDFLSFEQGKAVLMFKDWLSQHKKPIEPQFDNNF